MQKYSLNIFALSSLLIIISNIAVIYLLFELTIAYTQSSPKPSQQLNFKHIKYFTIGAIVGWLGTMGIFFPIFRINLYPYLNILIGVFPIFWAYAIIRHQLLDMDILFKKTLAYSILISIITTIYFVIVYILEKVLCIIVGYHSVPIAITVIAFFSIIFTPLKDNIQSLIDKYFFRGSIDQIDRENILLREELQKTEKLKAVATLAAGMAHEIKNPLTSIKTFTEYLSKKKSDPDFLEKFENIVGDEVDKINHIVKQLLEFSKPSELELKPTDINKLLDETLDLLNNDFLKNNIKIKKNYSTLSPANIDPTQIKQVFLNLLLNAIDSMKKGGIITATTSQEDNKIQISIKDTGKGIAKEDLKHIFDPFFTKKDAGTGLGLSVVHGIIDKHKGTIDVKSRVNEGTTFNIRI